MSDGAHASVIGLDELADAINAARPPLDPAGERVALAVYRLLAEGEPVSVAAVAKRVDQPPDSVERTLRGQPGVFRDEHGRVIGFHGLALGETPHRLRLNGRDLFAWCAWDTLFLPQLLQARAQIESRSPRSGEPVRLTVSETRVESLTPAEAVVSMLVPRRTFDADVVTSFCHFIHFFTSAHDAEPWIERHPDTFVLTVEQAFELGQITNRSQFPVALH